MTGYFLDTSALAKLYHFEQGSDYLDQLISQGEVAIWISRLSIVEMESVLSGKVRSGKLDNRGVEIARGRFRADLEQSRIVTGPPIDDKDLNIARNCLRVMVFFTGYGH